ncbi:MAG: response regulator transcription factor [Rhodothermales bacterium]|nr:response regulator transcription factor [Rhodothermales bacterium]
MSLRVLIVDDEPLARDTLRLLLESHGDVEIVGECGDGLEAIETIRSERPDVVFLDVQMPGCNGFEVVERVGPQNMPITVFATAYDSYALKAFDASALDYLLKPFDDERFEMALERAREAVGQRDDDEIRNKLEALIRRDRDAPFLSRIMVKSRDSVTFVNVDEIQWVESAGDYVTLKTHDKSHLIRETMTGLEDKLDPSRFVRIHRSTIVNLDYVKELKPYFHGDYIVYMNSGKELKLSRRYWDRVEAAINRD